VEGHGGSLEHSAEVFVLFLRRRSAGSEV
jgi:hypothetical protein